LSQNEFIKNKNSLSVIRSGSLYLFMSCYFP